MSFKYINPGWAELLDVGGGQTIQTTTQSRTGTAFYQPTPRKGLNLETELKDFYGKFDIYIPKDGTEQWVNISLIRADGRAVHGISFEKTSSQIHFMRCYGNNSITTEYVNLTSSDQINIRLDSINTIQFHVKPGDDGCIWIFANNKLVDTFKHEISFEQSQTLAIYVSNANSAISNLILSDEEIDGREQVLVLPVSATDTDMTAGEGGAYIADKEGQQLLQTIDAAELMQEYGADSVVKGIEVVGNPAHRTAEGLASLTAIEKDETGIREYGKATVPAASRGITSGRSVSMTIAELAKHQFGWKAGA